MLAYSRGAAMHPEFCLNCEVKLEGPYCHSCGQPVKGMIRHLKSVVHDFMDTVFEYDSRIWRTLIPLFLLPGQITLDYVAGKRVRFVLPFRLFFVLTVVAFLLLQITIQPTTPSERLAAQLPGLGNATTVEEVIAARERAHAGLDQALAEVGEGPVRNRAAMGIERARVNVDRSAQRRIDWLEAVEAARADGRPPPPAPTEGSVVYLGGDSESWDPVTNPVSLVLLPDYVNARLNDWIGRAIRNIDRLEAEPRRFMDSFLGILPAVLFVLMPIFALLLKLFHAFTGRLYMEHMVVALHSHSFLALALIVAVGFSTLAQALPEGSIVAAIVRAIFVATVAWVPVYMLIMQRRVYGQGWGMTLLKFSVIGTLYLLLVTAGVSVAVMVTLIQG
jgi:hypothetical protein